MELATQPVGGELAALIRDAGYGLADRFGRPIRTHDSRSPSLSLLSPAEPVRRGWLFFSTMVPRTLVATVHFSESPWSVHFYGRKNQAAAEALAEQIRDKFPREQVEVGMASEHPHHESSWHDFD